jgi:predicted TPR repeat methyltransferase
MVQMPMPLFASSGDLIADRRYDFACAYLQDDDLPAAADLLLQAIELAPRFAAAWFALGDVRERSGDRAGAIEAFRQARDLDLGDRHGAALRLARLDAGPGKPMSPGYVRALFDQYAPRFDEELVGRLGYRGPELLLQAVEAVAGAGAFARLIDLGCGTGLAGKLFAPLCDFALGVDLSAAMVERARRQNLYQELVVADMAAFLAQQPAASADLVIAADAFCYLADLTPICRAVARVLPPGGLVAFTVETHAGDGAVLGAKLRYAHAAGHVRAALEAAGLAVRFLQAASTRNENCAPVPGLVVVAQR